MKEEMRHVLQALHEDGQITLRGQSPLSEGESTRVRHTLARKLGLPARMLDGVKDEIRVLQRNVVLQIAKDLSKDQAAAPPDAEETAGKPGQGVVKAVVGPADEWGCDTEVCVHALGGDGTHACI